MKDRKSMVQIEAESTQLDFHCQVAIGRRDHTNINRPFSRFTNPPDSPFLQHSQQCRLRAQRKFTKLIQENGALISTLDQANPVLLDPGV